jgi:hypothetical protein
MDDPRSGVGRMPGEEREWISVFSGPKPGGISYVRLLGAPKPIWLHWVNEQVGWRSRPCLGQDCRLCREHVRALQYWYAPGLHWKIAKDGWRWVSSVVLLTDGGFANIANRSFYGLALMLRRAKSGKASGLVAVPITETPSEQKPVDWPGCYECNAADYARFRIGGWLVDPKERFDCQPILMRMWGLRTWPDQRLVEKQKPPARDSEPAILKFPGRETA